jgi:hypothetical protein
MRRSSEQAVKVQQQKARQQAAAKGKPKPLTSDAQMTFGNTYQQAVKPADADRPGRNHGRAGGRAALLNGLPAGHEEGPQQAPAWSRRRSRLRVKPIANTLAARVALDMYYDGHLSKETIRILRRNGVRVKALPNIRMNTPCRLTLRCAATSAAGS